MKFTIISLVVVAVIFIWRRYCYIARPEFPTRVVEPDAPLMRDATTKAKASSARIRGLATQPKRGIRIKIPFVSGSGMTEYLRAEVLPFKVSPMDVRASTWPRP